MIICFYRSNPLPFAIQKCCWEGTFNSDAYVYECTGIKIGHVLTGSPGIKHQSVFQRRPEVK